MATITKSELKKHITDALEEGLSNKGIAEYLNAQFNIPEDQGIPASDVPFYKEKVGLKGMRPKKKRFFTIIEDEDSKEAEQDSAEEEPRTEYYEEPKEENPIY